MSRSYSGGSAAVGPSRRPLTGDSRPLGGGVEAGIPRPAAAPLPDAFRSTLASSLTNADGSARAALPRGSFSSPAVESHPPAALRPVSAGPTPRQQPVAASSRDSSYDSSAALTRWTDGPSPIVPPASTYDLNRFAFTDCFAFAASRLHAFEVYKYVFCLGRSASAPPIRDELDPDDDDDLDASKGALYKRKDFLGIEEEGSVMNCVCAIVYLSASPYGKRACACAQRPGLPQACGCG
jgi:hypothetical protein